MRVQKYYLTTAIPYVNAAPHLGHVLEFVQADAIARYQRLCGKDVALVTGADENSLKNVQAAEKLGISVEELCARNSEEFRKIAGGVGLSYTSFRNTSDRGKHWPGVQMLWELCAKNGDIYKKKYRGLYCVGCEAFYEQTELVDGLCPEHKAKPEEIEEENYFFRLSKYEGRLLELIESGELAVLPETRKNEVLSFIRGGLKDFSVSRSVARAKGWGVPVPGDETQIEYVWFDALGTYITGIGYGFDQEHFDRYWPADAHVIGKGILRFHAVYWPAMLLSAGLPLPKTIFVHGYITVEGQKMSKSLGNVVDPAHLASKYGVDPLRYALLGAIPTFEDGDFSERTLAEANNNELLANVGNLVNRTLVFAHREFEGKVPSAKPSDDDEDFLKSQQANYAQIGKFLDKLQLKDALHLAMHCGKEANAYFQKSEPWKTAKSDREKCAASIHVLLHQVKDLAIALEPFLPNTSAGMFKQLNIAPCKWDCLGRLTLEAGHALGKPEILFTKIEGATTRGSQKEAQKSQHQAKPHEAHADKHDIRLSQAQQPNTLASSKNPEPLQKIPLSALDLEVGRIISIEKHPNAAKLYVEQVQMGNSVRQIVSGLVPYLKEEELLGKLVIIVKNLKPALLRGKESSGMLLAAWKGETLEVLSPEWAKPGDKAVPEGEEGSAAQARQITIDQFAALEFQSRAGVALLEGKRLLVSGKPVLLARVTDGKIS